MFRDELLVCALLFALAATAGLARTGNSRSAMVGAARAFLDSLTPTQLAKAAVAFDSEERTNWHYVPRERRGLPLKEMTEPQRERARSLLKAGLSERGYLKATTIMSLELVLRALEGGHGPTRDPELFYFTVFGSPSEKEPWGWRVEGHHLSLNFTVVEAKPIATAPTFLGSNPAEVRQGNLKGTRVLAREEDLARRLLHSLSDDLRRQAVFQETAPADIVTGAARKVDPLRPEGLPASRMGSEQKALLLALLEEYARTMPEDLAEERLGKVRKAGLDKVSFAWAGGAEPGQPHYYRLQGPTFLVEYDNTQNDANHIHTVWRDFGGDFGRDLLREHYERDPHHQH